jgi:site-specific recombinase XerD
LDFTEQFSGWLNIERGFSTATISNYSWHANQFLQWCQDHNRPLNTIQASDVDAFLGSRNEKGWCRVSTATCAKALKAFFLYSEERSWCQPLIARAIQGPRLFSQETLPSGPSWGEVNHIIDSLATDHTRDIRDRAIILLFALYGLRSGEIARLRLDEIDWETRQLYVYRSKQGKSQTYPLTPLAAHRQYPAAYTAIYVQHFGRRHHDGELKGIMILLCHAFPHQISVQKERPSQFFVIPGSVPGKVEISGRKLWT